VGKNKDLVIIARVAVTAGSVRNATLGPILPHTKSVVLVALVIQVATLVLSVLAQIFGGTITSVPNVTPSKTGIVGLSSFVRVPLVTVEVLQTPKLVMSVVMGDHPIHTSVQSGFTRMVRFVLGRQEIPKLVLLVHHVLRVLIFLLLVLEQTLQISAVAQLVLEGIPILALQESTRMERPAMEKGLPTRRPALIV